mmetsp:Transcript_85131/g.150574  ORF Transcript_85131/g.150574 Transcript_85131/m.150574 type:complete len:459 (-) Transcript_85131:205-1581(-)|eukprot:CAMPEP_0197626014 /NCGR_PEP_ID=MMETSP1338-20131121/5183_1 /TAXON_ID=43686 ORGANISM="Pelagodinium beii, Strain RCC1491" /NCGR_SAMPLE_ID=MMETSP1338 /ASSEMBLY_ACC=CAM_ASM_000754 /LENGTH=458 /DNA_ID=CAMNT_0043196531 /DNA_START=40 /DNA_END=1416 /DNA_ORIENTATION=-
MVLLEAEFGGQLKLINLEFPAEAGLAEQLQLIEQAIVRDFKLMNAPLSLGYFDDEADLCVLTIVTLPDFLLLASDSSRDSLPMPRIVAHAKPMFAEQDGATGPRGVIAIEQAGQKPPEISDAENKLWRAMRHPEAMDDLVCALSMALHHGASATLIEEAEQLLKKGGRAALEEGLALGLFAAGTSQGSTWRHRVLVPLLSSFLTSPSSSGSMALPALLDFLPETSRAFSLFPQTYGMRGGRPYFKPVGWLRFSLKCADFDRCKDWCIAYHGSQGENVLSILARGLKCPQRSQDVRHGQAGGTGRTIYLSPSIEYAAHPVYSPLIQLGPAHWAQLIIECRVAPWAYRRQGRTLPPHMWPVDLPFDPYFPLGTRLEWLVEDQTAVVVTGLMIREFGAGAAAGSLYGEAAGRVTQGSGGASVEWGHLRVKELRRLLRSQRLSTPMPMLWQQHAHHHLVSAA